MSRIIPLSALPASLQRDADLCVKCGLCLAHCPTYRLTLHEADSPRGRIALIHGLASGQLGSDPGLTAHLDGCLTCRACEAACPADVPFGQLMDSARTLLAAQRPARTRLVRMLAAVLTRPRLRNTVAALLWLYQRSGLQALLRRLRFGGIRRLARLDSLMPRIAWPRPPRTAVAGGTPVALFTNCTSPLADRSTLEAAVRVLEHLGCAVSVPASQTCCGALHQHSGLAEPARRCARRNVAAFADAPAVVGVASGCTAQLLEYDLLLDDPEADPFSRKVQDIHAYIATHPRLAALRFRPSPQRVLLHTPCTLRNVLNAAAPVRRLLERIPGLEIVEMDSLCCGAAGSYFISQPEVSDRLLEPKIVQAKANPPDLVLSSNIGCALHLAAGLRRAGITAPVWHPLRLLAQQLDDSSAAPPGAGAGARPARPA